MIVRVVILHDFVCGKYLSMPGPNHQLTMIIQLPKLDSSASIDDWTQAVAERTDTDEAVVEAIVSEVQNREAADATTETPWDSESSGMTYMWPANEHGDF